MSSSLNNLIEKFDRLAIRERVLLWGIALLVITLTWYTQLQEPVDARYTAIMAELGDTDPANSESSLSRTNAALQEIITLREQIQQYDQQLKSASNGLISATQMNAVIHELLDKQASLQLINLNNEPTRELASNESHDPEAIAANSGVYLHPVQITIEGQFNDILRYLRSLEASDWRFNWQSFELNTTHYPISRARIEISTLSLDQSLLGI
ncbi:MAG: hypothetical protein AB7F79_03800 [Steroidobacteraceae bacterium]